MHGSDARPPSSKSPLKSICHSSLGASRSNRCHAPRLADSSFSIRPCRCRIAVIVLAAGTDRRPKAKRRALSLRPPHAGWRSRSSSTSASTAALVGAKTPRTTRTIAARLSPSKSLQPFVARLPRNPETAAQHTDPRVRHHCQSTKLFSIRHRVTLLPRHPSPSWKGRLQPTKVSPMCPNDCYLSVRSIHQGPLRAEGPPIRLRLIWPPHVGMVGQRTEAVLGPPCLLSADEFSLAGLYRARLFGVWFACHV